MRKVSQTTIDLIADELAQHCHSPRGVLLEMARAAASKIPDEEALRAADKLAEELTVLSTHRKDGGPHSPANPKVFNELRNYLNLRQGITAKAEEEGMNWAILFNQPGVGPEVFDYEGVARERFSAVSSSYNCGLFKCIERG